MDDKMLLKRDLKEKRELINITLDRFLPRKDDYPKDVHKAIRHTLFAGGKRLRPYLCILTYTLFEKNLELIRPIASAIEMLHTYTLIHDDLPEIDNDDYRRGKKACHVVYGPDIALLAGDALLVSSFEIISNCDLPTQLKIKIIKELSAETGDRGLIAGQMVDIESEGKNVSKETLDFIHKNKTARMIDLPIRFGCLVANASNNDIDRMSKYGNKLGLAFQIVDDILDIEGSKAILGKTIGKDAIVKKATYPSIYGLDKSKKMAKDLIDECLDLLNHYGEKAHVYKLLTNFVYTRKF